MLPTHAYVLRAGRRNEHKDAAAFGFALGKLRVSAMIAGSLRNNIAALGTVQVVNLLLPLVTLPYLTRVLGADSLGRLVIAQVVLQYFVMFSDWSFSWTTTRELAIARSDPVKVSQISSATWLAQWTLVAVSLVILLSIVCWVPALRADYLLYAFGVGLLVGNALLPIWLFNGLEYMRQLAAFQLMAKAIAVPLIFAWVNSPGDGPYVMAITGAANIIAGLIGLMWLKGSAGYKFSGGNIADVGAALSRGRSLFLSRIWTSLYSMSPTVVLGVVAGSEAAAYYSLADKFRLGAQWVASPLTQALFPRISHLFATDRVAAWGLLRRSGTIFLLLLAGVSMGLWLGADIFVRVLGGEQFQASVGVLRWLSPLPFVIGISLLLGIQVMLPNNMNKAFSRIAAGGAVVGLGLIVSLSYWKGAEGAAAALLTVESMISLAMLVVVRKSGLLDQARAVPAGPPGVRLYVSAGVLARIRRLMVSWFS